ncbi:MAG: sensor histidine kinase [Gemmatimonadota bacterium]
MSRRLLPVAIAGAFTAILLSFLLYTRQMARELRRDAAAFSRIYFRVVQATTGPQGWTPEREFELLQELYALQVPVVQTDLEGTPTGAVNLPFEANLLDSASVARVRAYAEELDALNAPLVEPESRFEIHFGEPLFLRRLKWIPWLQAALLLAVVSSGVWMIRTSFRSERERIWTAMARESAHQMGTPLSSLVGWLEQVEEGTGADADGLDPVAEMRTDVERLQKVSRRFELIGRVPALEPVDVGRVLERLGRYFSARLPSLGSRVRLAIEVPPGAGTVTGNATLLEWVFENLIKNGLDALAGREGEIRVESLGVRDGKAEFRVADTGPGVPPELRDTLFDIGTTTKEGGWGVGLSLARRIVVDMHGGDLELEHPAAGASFRIGLPVAGGAA